MVQIKCLSNGLYSLKNSHIPFGMGFQPPLMADFHLNSTSHIKGLPLVAAILCLLQYDQKPKTFHNQLWIRASDQTCFFFQTCQRCGRMNSQATRWRWPDNFLWFLSFFLLQFLTTLDLWCNFCPNFEGTNIWNQIAIGWQIF